MLTAANKSLPQNPPVILVSGSLAPLNASDWLKSKLKVLANNVFSILKTSGSKYHFVEASTASLCAEEALSHVDGLLILGGGDADPACYGQTHIADNIYAVNRHADELELSLINHALIRDLPILGICRGMQLINIALGGELHQDIGVGCHSGTTDNSVMVTHNVQLTEHTTLHSVYSRPVISIRSGHHQAVSALGNGLVTSAQSADGIIEAIEAPAKNWVIGVQWHPEDCLADKDDFALLIHSFLHAANGACNLTAYKTAAPNPPSA